MSADHEERLRRLALHDDHLMRSMLAIPPGHADTDGLDPKSCALVRLGVLVALDASGVSYQWGVQWALDAGATADEVVGALMAVAPVVGVARVVAAVPEFALALGIDIDAALEDWNGGPAEGR
jgi:alkylhydroperoxidase/carboxymuconolactone decarboxylase family protein YurZ